jgi:hypothetical protein
MGTSTRLFVRRYRGVRSCGSVAGRLTYETGQPMPASRARTIACARLATCSLPKMLLT